jgi:hypothetical protein
MNFRVAFEQLVDVPQGKRAIYADYGTFLQPLSRQDRFAGFLRRICCAWCRECEQYFIDAESLNALHIVEEFSRGNAAGDALFFARKLARKAARRVTRRTKGKTKEYWASHAVCEAARNDAYESMLWTSTAMGQFGLSADRKLEVFRDVLQGMSEC